MEMNNLIQTIESAGGTLGKILNILLVIGKFLFLTPWGWIIIIVAFFAMVVFRVKNGKEEVTFYTLVGGITESVMWLYSNVTNILIGFVVVLALGLISVSFSGVADSLKLFKEVKTLEMALKNLTSERKVLEVQATPVVVGGTNRMNVTVTYYAYSPVQERDLETGQKVFVVDGSRLYADFGVINFKYSLIESGDQVNIAFPNRLYSDNTAYADGDSLVVAEDGMPLTFKLDGSEIYLMEQPAYEAQINHILEYATNAQKARLLGIRTIYGQAIAIDPKEGTVYKFYSTGAGGVVMR